MSEQFCEPHLRRTGEKILAARVVAGTPMCLRCVKGSPIESTEDRIALPFCRTIGRALAGGQRQTRTL